MKIVIDNTPKATIQSLLDMEGPPDTILLIGKHPDDPNRFEFGTAVAEGNIDISPVGVAVCIMPDADRAGTFRLNYVDGEVTLTEAPNVSDLIRK